VRPSPATVLACLALFVALGGTGYAILAPDGQGRLTACAHVKTGALRLVEPGKACRKKTRKFAGERAVRWSVTGPPGAAGPAGSPGAAGAAGKDGRNGAGIAFLTHSTGPVTASASEQTIPLTSSTWRQAGDEVHQLFTRATITGGDGCTSSSPGFEAVNLRFFVDGELVGTLFSVATTEPVSADLGALFEPGEARERELVVKVSDTCASGDHFVVDKVSLTAISAR
jgi:hypothetical protein